ncbi:MAG TPA: cytochrome P450 [Ktedonobacterales bacterium]|nr:cytochrome P450 [Ktedonobacterales bacterium]
MSTNTTAPARRTASALQRTPPGPRGLPVVGSLPQFRRDPLGFFQGLQRSYGDIVTVTMMGVQVTLFMRPEYTYYFFVDHAQAFDSGSQRDIMKRFLGEGLLTTDGEIHRRQRRLVQPAFHKKRVEGYAEIMTSQTEQMLNAWRPGAELNISRELQELTLRIIVQALFDLDLQTQSHELSQLFTDVVENQPPGLVSRGLPPLPFGREARGMAARDKLDEFVYGLIAQRRAEGVDRGDVLSMLLKARDEDGAAMDDKQVRDQTMTLIAAGHETTTNALSWTFHLLSQNPAAYDRLLAEVCDVLGDRAPTVDDLPRMPYLDSVITESLRIYPPAWTVNRFAREPFELGGYQFPARTRAIIPQWVVHHLPEVWGDPQSFRPERWTPGFRQSLPRGAYFPFGMGPRICIGMPLAEMEMRLVLATILQRYTPRVIPGWPVQPFPRITLRLAHGLGVRLEPAAQLAALSARQRADPN